MDLTKRYPLLNMYQGSGDALCHNSLTFTSNKLLDLKKLLRSSRKSFVPNKVSLIDRTSIVPLGKVLSTPEEPNFCFCPTEMLRFSAWKSSLEYLGMPLTFRALPNPSMIFENKCFGALDASMLRVITQQLLNIFHLQHVCDLVNAVSASYNARMASKDIVSVTKVSDDSGVSVNAEISLPRKYENITKVEIEHCSNSYNIEKESANINSQGCNCSPVVEMLPVVKNKVKDSKEMVNRNSYNIGKKSTNMNSQGYKCSPVVETLPVVKNKVKDISKEMVNRKQRQINKHSKKRKRRMRKKSKISYSHEKDTNAKVMSQRKSSQIKSESQLSRSSRGNKTVFDDWEESDEDLCIVFEDEIDGACSTLPENMNVHPTRANGIHDLWIGFDSLTIVSDNSGFLVDCKSHNSEIFIQCDSDSEYEIDSGEILENSNDFDCWSGLLVLNNGVVGHSGFQDHVQHPSFTSRSYSLSESLVVSDDSGLHEIHEVNQRWREMTSEVNGEPRLSQQVTFAPEEDLVTVFPADIIERKSEWEQFAIERFRFKRRVDEFEKIIAPYLAHAHRNKAFKRMLAASS